MKKRKSLSVAFKVLLRVILKFVLGCAISLVFVRLLFRGTQLGNALFSTVSTAETALFMFLTWLLGVISGCVMAVPELLNQLMEEKANSESQRDEITCLRSMVKTYRKMLEPSPSALNMFREIESAGEADDSDEFLPLQDILAGKKTKANKEASTPVTNPNDAQGSFQSDPED